MSRVVDIVRTHILTPPHAVPAHVVRGRVQTLRPDDSADTAAWLGWLIISAFFGMLGTWTVIAPLRGAVVAPGVVMTDGNRKAIQHLEGGIVRRLAIREGDRVSAGDILLELDGTQARTELDVLDQLASVLLVTQARLHVEQENGFTVPLPAALATRAKDAQVLAAWRGQQAQLEARRRESDGQGEIIRQRIAQLVAQSGGSKAQLESLGSQLASMRKELETLQPLLEQGIVTRTRLLQLERSISAMEGQVGETNGAIARDEQAIAEQRQLEIQSRNQRATAISQELRDVEMRLSEVLPKLANARAVWERAIVRSPYRGRVVGLQVFAVGAVVGRGEKLMDIVPEDGALVVEARIAVEDIADVAAETPAEVRLGGHKTAKSLPLRAVVASVSADRLTDAHTGTPYYLASVRIDDADLAGLGDVKLQPGMPATVMIPTTSRTAFQYLVSPLWSSFDTAMRER